jgi:DNA-binding XRE family transcriptional regulator
MGRELDETRKEQLIGILTNELKMLRAKVQISQQELAERIGISRQTYVAIENKSQKMAWNNFLALLLIFKSNDDTARIIEWIGAYPPELESYIKLNSIKN